MPDTVDHDGRRHRSQRTRRQIVAAAERRLVDVGYVATTMEAVAAEAGVAVQTVYYVFGTKPKLLAAVLDTVNEAGGPEVAVVDRDWVGALATATDVTAAVTDMVAAGVGIIVRTALVHDVVRSAASIPEVGELLTEQHRRRRADQRHVVEVLAAAGHLPPGAVDQIADTVYALLNEEVFLLLDADCGWTTERYRTWVTDLLVDQIGRLDPDPPAVNPG